MPTPLTELRNVERELTRFRARLLVAAGLVLAGFFILVLRLVWLQVLKHEELSTQAEENRVSIVPIVPNRGLILDRNGIVLASNYSAYTLEITPSKLDAPIDAVIDELARLVDISHRDRRRFKKQLEESKSFESLPIRTRLSDEEVARFAAQRFRFPGVDIKARLFRSYPLGATASHVIGYIGRMNLAEQQRLADSPDEANYRGTEYIGKLGLEQSYERELHGITGFEEVEVSAGGRAVRRLKSNKATPGNTLVLSLDIRLQRLVEDLFGERRGALVAIDPSNGEVLAFVSKPTFDPNLFVDGIDSESWRELNESIDKPLLNRPLNGTYPPGSTYKPFMALAALQSGKRQANTLVNDPGYWMFGDHRFRSHGDEGLGAVDMARSIIKSSNVYYYSLANEMGVDLIHELMQPFGFGQRTGIDLLGETRGVLPSQEWKRNTYKRPEQRKWYAGETISLGIGQGYNSFTMLQLASATATLVAYGERYKPRLVREIEDVVTRERRSVSGEALPPVPLKPEHVDVVRRAMVGVTLEGTSARVFAGAPYTSGGKTGTAQAVTIRQNEKYNAAKLAEHLRDHSLYIAFAPAERPKVALAVVVENAGFGAQAAAPIARRVFDYLLLGRVPTPDEIRAQGGTPSDTLAQLLAQPLPAAAAAAAGPAQPPPATQPATQPAAQPALAAGQPAPRRDGPPPPSAGAAPVSPPAALAATLAR
jgi:penicillin-binding protein 2